MVRTGSAVQFRSSAPEIWLWKACRHLRADLHDKRRLRLARSFREAADHFSERELSDALSRSYYSIYHAAHVLLGKSKGLTQRKLRVELEKHHPKFAERIKKLCRLRRDADCEESWITREYGDDLDRFRLKVDEGLEEERTLFQELITAIESNERLA